MMRRPPRSTLSSSSAASDVYKRQALRARTEKLIARAAAGKKAPAAEQPVRKGVEEDVGDVVEQRDVDCVVEESKPAEQPTEVSSPATTAPGIQMDTPRPEEEEEQIFSPKKQGILKKRAGRRRASLSAAPPVDAEPYKVADANLTHGRGSAQESGDAPVIIVPTEDAEGPVEGLASQERQVVDPNLIKLGDY
eukprot:TRINITY_DN5456_c0_g1_i2.p1 TRINITY_DN5456_c0_g1~~TRINITY_DN5456_c0_g1_i2.p1  ORF type:complete len:193 (+),score=44.31 TRINITY_DN5456_c0_g1_i2:49-627(+)